jgi:hypothetical protein
MSNGRTQPRATRNQRQCGFIPSRRARACWLASRSVVLLFAIFTLAGMAPAQSQSAPSPAPQPQAQPQPQPKPVPRKTVASIADAARKAKSERDASAPKKVYTNDRVAALPPGGVSVVGSSGPAPGAISQNAKPADDTAKLAAYWKARFTAARQKLAQDKKALPALQAQLNAERVQEDSVDVCTGQVHSDTYMDLLQQIDSTKVAMRNDTQALSALHDEFRHAGGQPGWIR